MAHYMLVIGRRRARSKNGGEEGGRGQVGMRRLLEEGLKRIRRVDGEIKVSS